MKQQSLRQLAGFLIKATQKALLPGVVIQFQNLLLQNILREAAAKNLFVQILEQHTGVEQAMDINTDFFHMKK